MIIPIGHENTAVRRLPWVTWSILSLCFVVFLFTDTDAAHDPSARETYMDEAAQYFRERAYLDAAPEIEEEVRYDVVPNQRSQYLEVLRELTSGDAPETAEGMAEEQAELDRLTDLALGRVQPEGASENPYRKWGLTPEAPSLTTYVSHLFMHGGWLHLLGNLFLLFIIGPAIEDRWGRPIYGAFYVLAGVFAGCTFALMARDPSVPLVGASGAISGVMGAFMVLYWASQMKFAYFFWFGLRVVRGTFESPAWLVLPFWFAKDLFNAWFWDAAEIGSGVAYWAHVGGFAFGAAVAYGIKAARVEERFVHDRIESQVTINEGNPAVDAALARREEGDDEGAFAMLQEEIARNPGDPDAAIAFWDVAQVVGRPEAAAPALAELVRTTAADGNLALAVQHWLELTNVVPSELADPATLLRLAAPLREQGDDDRALQALRHAVDPGNPGLTPGMAMRVLEETRESDPPTAMRAVRIALDNPNLHEAKRAKLEALVEAFSEAGVEEPSGAQREAAVRAEAAPGRAPGSPVEVDFDDDPVPDDFLANRNATADESALRRDFDAGTGAGAVVAAAGARALALDASGGPVIGSPEAADRPPGGDHPPPPPARGRLAAAPTAIATPPPLPARRAPEAASDVPPAVAEEALDAIVALPRFSDLKSVEASPTHFTQDALYLQTPAARKTKIEFAKIEAIAVAAIRGLSEKPVLVIDLLLNWTDIGEEGPLRSVRIRSDRFDARRLASDCDRPGDALRIFAGELLARSSAVALPDAESAHGRPFRVCDDLPSYEREILQVER